MGKHNEVKNLYYWWDRKSIIDPTDVRCQYFRVFYDQKGRIIRIVKYSKDNDMLGYERLSWKGSWLVKIEEFSSDDVLQYKTTYHYNRLGFLVNEKSVSANGVVTSSLDNPEENLIDVLGEWLLRLLQIPIIEIRGLANYVKGRFSHLKFFT